MIHKGWRWLALVVALGGASSAAVGAPTSESVHFTALGDFNANANTSAVLTGIAADDPDATFTLGDLSYGAAATPTEESWCDFVTSRVGDGYPFEILSGNHESNGQDGNVNDFSACLPNQLPGLVGTYGRQYYVDVPQENPLIRYIGISPALPYPDGTWTYTAGSPRYEWTRSVIDGARQDGIAWVVVGMHKPCLSTGQYSCESGADLVNLLVDRKVDLVLAGHEHSYERTKQLALGTGCAAVTIGGYNPSCVADADNALQAGAGTVFLTIGTGGVPLRDRNAGDAEVPYFAAYNALNTTASYGFGDFQVTPDRLDFTFMRTSGGAFSDAFSLVRGVTPPNSPPTASFTSTSSGLTASFDGRGSSDPDGDITSYAWSFGDGAGGTGATTQRTYAAGGTYPVTLTVTDDDGASRSVTQQVTVTGGGVQVLASDDFTRTLANGWGTADTGGAWRTSGRTGETSVGSGAGRLTMSAPGRQPAANLNGLSTTDLDLSYELSFDKRPSSRLDTTVGLRRTAGGDYNGIVRLQANGSVRASIVRSVAGAGTTAISSDVTIPGLTYNVGDVLRVRGQAVGTSPTQLRLKVWKAGSPEPAAWTRTAQDSTAGLQTAGSIGFASYLSGSDTRAPLTAGYDAVRAVRASTLP